VQNLLGGDQAMKGSRTPEIMADAAYEILTKPAGEQTGGFLIDDDVLEAAGVSDFTKYAVDPEADLVPDFFL